MEPNIKSLKSFESMFESIPEIECLNIAEKVELFLNGIVPNLSERERELIESYIPRKAKVEQLNFADEVIDEIDFNVVKITDKQQLYLYLEYIVNILQPIVFALYKRSYNEKVESMDLYNNLKSPVKKEQRNDYQLLCNLLIYDDFYYHGIYDHVIQHVLSIQFRYGFIKTRIDPNEPFIILDETNDINKSFSKKTLKTLFKDKYKYDKLIAFMEAENLILKTEKALHWKGFKANRKYEIASFYKALYVSDFLIDNKRIQDKELCNIATNTFCNFNVSYKTITNKAYNHLSENYKEVLVRFIQSQQKPSQHSQYPS